MCFFEMGPMNLLAKQSECIGITGPSGIGKSLFLRAAAGVVSLPGMMTGTGSG